MEDILSSLGISGGVVSLVIGGFFVLRRICNSKCVKTQDGSVGIQITLKAEDAANLEGKKAHEILHYLSRKLEELKEVTPHAESQPRTRRQTPVATPLPGTGVDIV